jgi:hypothetical protein
VEKEVLPWMQGHERLGSDSPQALSAMRCITRCVWKQGRYEDAREWIERCRVIIEGLRGGQFGKYQDDERKQLKIDVEDLEKCRVAHGGV